MGGLDDRPPKIIMLNNKQSLKATLSQKAAEIGPATDIAHIVSHARTTAAELPLTVTISIAVPLADAARYLEQLQQFLQALCHGVEAGGEHAEFVLAVELDAAVERAAGIDV